MSSRFILTLSFSVLAGMSIALSDANAQTSDVKHTKQAPPTLTRFEPQIIQTELCPSGVAFDGDTMYISFLGKEYKPTEKDDDGFVGKMVIGKDTEPTMLTKPTVYAAPKGIAVDKEGIYVTDLDNAYALVKEDGNLDGAINVSSDLPMTYLDGLVSLGDGRIIMAARDLNRIYIADTRSMTYAEIVTKIPLNAPSSLAWDPKKRLLYVAEFASVEKNGKEEPTGRLLSVNILTGDVTPLEGVAGRKILGKFSGIAVDGDDVYFSDWTQDGKPEVIRRLELKSGRVTSVATQAMRGLVHFVLRGNQIIAPSVTEKKIYIFDLKKKK
jgi:DNA-binding beta-propeller fold protein YncE